MRGKKPRKRSWLPGTVPIPFERWLDALIHQDIWKDDPTLQAEWLDVLRQLVSDHGCRLIVDSARHWQESVYFQDYRKKGPTILAGAARSTKYESPVTSRRPRLRPRVSISTVVSSLGKALGSQLEGRRRVPCSVAP